MPYPTVPSPTPYTDTCSLNIEVPTLKICTAHYGQTVSAMLNINRLQTFANALSNASDADIPFPSNRGINLMPHSHLLALAHQRTSTVGLSYQQLGFFVSKFFHCVIPSQVCHTLV